ncbi:MAG: RagB/SusD family nutrient uptake outer membrane protein [Prolixibacteraceae bacterium]|nr:RagB/SusD family nutrient uptake outer membrane protein [Prolixibacteraceae bacterium]
MKNISFNAKITISILILLFIATGCEDILDQKPLNGPVAETFYSNETEVTQAVNAIYDILNGHLYSGNNPVALIQMEDNMYKGTNPNDGFGLSQINSVDIEPTNPYVLIWYQSLYQGINRANVAIERIPLMEVPLSISEEAKNRLLAEATFLRGLFYFYLVRLFGEVPVVLESATDPNATGLSKSTEDIVWKQVEKDFLDAIPNLPESYSENETGRVTNGAAKSFLGQVYMWTNQPDKALSLFKEVIDSHVYELEDDYIDNFLESNFNSKEAVFAIQYKDLGGTAESASWIKSIGVRGQRPLVNESGYGFMVGTKELLENYDEGDIRRNVSFWEYGKLSPTNQNAKYNATLSSPFHLNVTDVGPMKWWWARQGYYNQTATNLALIRYSDVLLYFAESSNEVNNGPNEEAYAAINQVRDRAGVDDLPGEMNKSEFFEAVLKERRAEFVFEFQRWWDLARTKTAERFFENSVYKAGKFNPAKHYKWPLPQVAIDRNNALVQNPAYQ